MEKKKRVYTFGNGKAEGNAQMRELLGGKGANCAEMNLVGVPVPPGFTITTEVCNEYYQVGQEKIVAELTNEVNAAVAHIEGLMNCKFGDPKNPLLVSVRSGARASVRRSEEPAPRFRSFGCTCVHAGYDGYDPQPRSE